MKKEEEKNPKFDIIIQKVYMLILSDALSSHSWKAEILKNYNYNFAIHLNYRKTIEKKRVFLLKASKCYWTSRQRNFFVGLFLQLPFCLF